MLDAPAIRLILQARLMRSRNASFSDAWKELYLSRWVSFHESYNRACGPYMPTALAKARSHGIPLAKAKAKAKAQG